MKNKFELNFKILNLYVEILSEITKIELKKIVYPSLTFQTFSNIKSIHASLSLSNKALRVEQITDLANNERVFASEEDILLCKNLLEVYMNQDRVDPLDINELFKIYGILIKGLNLLEVEESCAAINERLEELFHALKDEELPWLIKGIIFNYELENINHFNVFNDILARLWQQLILAKQHPIFRFLPFDVKVKENEKDYLKAIKKSLKINSSNPFVEFYLEILLKALKEYGENSVSDIHDLSFRLEYARRHFRDKWFKRKEYLDLHYDIAAVTVNRDLNRGINEGILLREGEFNQTKYRFYSKN